MYEKKSKTTEVIEKDLRLKYNKFLLDTVIPFSNLLSEATYYGKPLCLYKNDSQVTIAYFNLTNEIIQKSCTDILSNLNKTKYQFIDNDVLI